jgi:hypothetical protein
LTLKREQVFDGSAMAVRWQRGKITAHAHAFSRKKKKPARPIFTGFTGYFLVGAAEFESTTS